MKIYLLLAALLLSSATELLSQDLSKDFGKVTDYELKMTSYSRDAKAGAVVLYDVGMSSFVERGIGGYEVLFERTTKIKILKETGMSYATFSIPYYQEGAVMEQIEGLIAITYNLENGVVKKTSLDQSGFYDEKVNEYWMNRIFTMPDAKPGSVIEIKYSIRSPYLMNLHDWEFQWEIPVISTKYVTKMIPFYEYIYILQGSNQFSTRDSYADKSNPRTYIVQGTSQKAEFFDMVYSFGMLNVPAYTDNDFISSRNDYIIKIDFQLSKVHQIGGTEISIISTWPQLIKDLQGNDILGKFMSRSEGQLKVATGETKQTGKTELEIYNDIMSYVKNNYRWDGVNSKYPGKSADKFVKDKEGNSAEINLFAVGLLRAAGLDASPLLISTRWNGKIKSDYPFLHYFNNIIVAVRIGEEYIIGDATEPLLPNNRIPERCINESGLLIKKGETTWINLQPREPSAVNTEIEQIVGEFETKITIGKSYEEFSAYDYRKKILSDNEFLSEYTKGKNYSSVDEDIAVQNLHDPALPLEIKYSGLEKTNNISGKLYINPFLKESDITNPLTQTTRTQPLDFIYPISRSYISNIRIPDGYDVEFLPTFPSVDNPLFSLTYSAERDGSSIRVQLKYHFKEGIYKATDYNALKQYFNEIIKYSNEKIILKKI